LQKKFFVKKSGALQAGISASGSVSVSEFLLYQQIKLQRALKPYGAPRKKKHTQAKLSPRVFLIRVKLLATLLRLRLMSFDDQAR